MSTHTHDAPVEGLAYHLIVVHDCNPEIGQMMDGPELIDYHIGRHQDMIRETLTPRTEQSVSFS